MAEETPTNQTTPEKEEPAKVEETPPTQTTPEKKEPAKTAAPKKKGGWFQKIPKDVLLSPGGVILVFFALLIEIIDWIPIPLIDQLWELPLEIIFILLLTIIAKVPLKASVIPFIIERIPIINDILPTWLIRMFT